MFQCFIECSLISCVLLGYVLVLLITQLTVVSVISVYNVHTSPHSFLRSWCCILMSFCFVKN